MRIWIHPEKMATHNIAPKMFKLLSRAKRGGSPGKMEKMQKVFMNM
jgi:hypothetical protein